MHITCRHYTPGELTCSSYTNTQRTLQGLIPWSSSRLYYSRGAEAPSAELRLLAAVAHWFWPSYTTSCTSLAPHCRAMSPEKSQQQMPFGGWVLARQLNTALLHFLLPSMFSVRIVPTGKKNQIHQSVCIRRYLWDIFSVMEIIHWHI